MLELIFITIIIIMIMCIIMVEEYLRCASGWSSFPEDARANHLPLNYLAPLHIVLTALHITHTPLQITHTEL